MSQVPTPPELPPLPDFIFWNEIIIPLAGMVTAIILGVPILRAVVRRLERGGSEGSAAEVTALRAEVAEMQTRLQSVEEVTQQMIELEERLDFAERMLAQQRRKSGLAAGD